MMFKQGVAAAIFAAFAVPAGAVPLEPFVELNGGSGSVDVTAPPGLDMRIDMVGSDNGTSGLDAVWDGPVETLVSFFYGGTTAFMLSGSWTYTAGWDDGPAWDPFGYVLDSFSFEDLTDWAGANEQSGTFSFLVNPQSTFGFYIYSYDNANGAATARIDIPSGVIQMPAPIPLPASVALLLPALGALGLMRRRARAHG